MSWMCDVINKDGALQPEKLILLQLKKTETCWSHGTLKKQ